MVSVVSDYQSYLNQDKEGYSVTANQSLGQNEAPVERVSTSAPLPFNPADLAQGVRVSQADFARMCGVSRQTVSRWVKLGKIKHTYPDGSLDPARAAREVIRNTDPTRLRAKVFRVATEDAQALRVRVADLERELAAAKAYIDALPQALRGIGLSEPQIECVEWMASGGEAADEDQDTEDAGAESGPGLPLFDGPEPADTPEAAPQP